MVTQTSELVSSARARTRPEGITLCHFSVRHSTPKSRSFHMECLPLASSGADVRYVTPSSLNGHIDGVDFVPLPQRSSRLMRCVASFSLLAKLLRQRANVYHFQDPELLPVAFLLKLAFRKRILYDAYEDFPSLVLNKTAIPLPVRSIGARIVSALETLAANLFDGLMTADPFTLRRLARAGKSKKLVFYNFPNLNFFPTPSNATKLFDIVYRGGLSERAGTYVLLDAMRLLANEGRHPRLLLIGYSDSAQSEEDLRQRIASLGLESSIEIRSRIEHERMAATLGQARIGVSPLQAIPKFLLNIPVKVFEYWACGLPVIASDLPSIRPFFRNAEAGLLFKPGDAAGLAQCLGSLLENPELARSMGANGRAAVESRFNNRSEAHKLRKFCARVAKAADDV